MWYTIMSPHIVQILLCLAYTSWVRNIDRYADHRRSRVTPRRYQLIRSLNPTVVVTNVSLFEFHSFIYIPLTGLFTSRDSAKGRNQHHQSDQLKRFLNKSEECLRPDHPGAFGQFFYNLSKLGPSCWAHNPGRLTPRRKLVGSIIRKWIFTNTY